MRAIAVGLLASTMLSGCSDPVGDAKNEVAFVEQWGSQQDICDANRKLEVAAQEAKDADAYMAAKINGSTACGNAQFGIDPRSSNATEQADNMMRMAEEAAMNAHNVAGAQ